MNKQKGMTIIEIMVVLAIIVILFSVIYSSITMKTFEGKQVDCSGGVLYFVDVYRMPQTPVIDKNTKEPVLCTENQSVSISDR